MVKNSSDLNSSWDFAFRLPLQFRRAVCFQALWTLHAKWLATHEAGLRPRPTAAPAVSWWIQLLGTVLNMCASTDWQGWVSYLKTAMSQAKCYFILNSMMFYVSNFKLFGKSCFLQLILTQCCHCIWSYETNVLQLIMWSRFSIKCSFF